MLDVGYCEVWKGGVCGSGALPAGMLLHLHNLLLLVLLLLLPLALHLLLLHHLHNPPSYHPSPQLP